MKAWIRTNVRAGAPHRAQQRGSVWSFTIVPAILARDGHRCVMCGRPCPHPRHHHVDHRIPRANGGADTPNNLRTVCAQFNLRGTCAS